MGCCNRTCGLIALAAVGAVVAVVGALLIPLGNWVIESTVVQESVIEPGTTAYDNWVSTGAAVYRQFWFFDVQNAADVVKNGSAPVVVQRGPYTYKTRFLPKEDITRNSNFTISFVLPPGAIFEPSMSVGPEDDNITSLNLVVAGAYGTLPHLLVEIMVTASKSSLFHRRTVKELLWGYYDPILRGTVGLFVTNNDTVDELYNVFTGKDDISKVAMIDRWRGERNLTFWDDPYCDMINGTDGSSFAPFVDKNVPLYFFSSDICRSVSASFKESLDLRGIQVYRYSLLESTLASPNVNPDNACFCKDQVTTKNCSLAGVLDIRTCQNGKPVYISLPHFLFGSKSLQDNIVGLNPVEEEHFTYLDVEPTTGFTLRFAKRIQVNMMYGPSKIIKILRKVKDYTIFPLVWLNETAELDEPTAQMFKKELFSRIELLDVIQKSLIGIGVGVFGVALIALLICRTRLRGHKLA